MKLFSIIIAHLILFQSSYISLEDYTRLNELLEHASFHKEQYGDTFFDFLSEHYIENYKNHGDDHKEHSDLPFKHDQQSCHHLSFDFTINMLYYPVAELMNSDRSLNFFYENSYSLFEKSSVFQPPKTV